MAVPDCLDTPPIVPQGQSVSNLGPAAPATTHDSTLARATASILCRDAAPSATLASHSLPPLCAPDTTPVPTQSSPRDCPQSMTCGASHATADAVSFAAPLEPPPTQSPAATDQHRPTPHVLETPIPPGFAIDHDFDHVNQHGILRLKPSRAQWEDFPSILAYARSLGVENDGCFKVTIPHGIHDLLPEKEPKTVPANAYKVKQMRRTTYWQVSTVPSDGEFSSADSASQYSGTVNAAFKNLRRLFKTNKNRQMRNVRYRVDVPAWTAKQRREAGVPERSPIHPLKGDKLDLTKAIIPGIHTPYVYESGPSFGATFQIHAEDFRLASLNHLYKGRKIWVVVPATAVHVAEHALGRGEGCSQFMRHRAEFFFPDRLDKMGIPYRLVDQRPGETIVILPDAYHEGFSTGYTIAEAKNYADARWSPESYQPCEESCQLATAIPAAFMRPVAADEPRLDLCAAYGDCKPMLTPHEPKVELKRRLDEFLDDKRHASEQQQGAALAQESSVKRIKV
ncbi:hypothetical protein CDD82_600 [Ophiocordyceps australis]|uniref:JmjC domain-containing protein n=1 Tax=Ophiocordyceps australis TaxID=1399860 RepID=A0A2C5YN79_9HYPO|nr:hypothetical protein CDD82_600 [Ophiocordyceps australis]